MSTNLSRRRFLGTSAAAAGTLVVGFHIPFAGEASAQGAAAGTPPIPPEINAWVVVRPDDTVVIRIARSEMGQGTLTGLAQLVAEELDCNWAKVTTEYPTPGQNLARNRVWGNFSTGGSRGIRESQEYVRKGGATARMMLVQAAADAWQVPVAECVAADSVITHKPSGRTTTYGRMSAAAAKIAPPADVPLKDPKDWKLAGKRLARLDTADKVTGAQVYGMDLKMPGLLNAAIRDCPVFGGKIRSVDAAAVLKRRGVKKVVRVGDSAVAVVADTWWHAKTALDALPIEWDYGPNAKASSAAFAEVMKAGLDAGEAAVGNQVGDARAAIAAAPRRIEAVYSYPHQNHATMETMNATARWTPERCEVWTPTQNGEAALAAAAEAAGLPLAKCEVYKLLLGGGFGRRGAVHDWVRQVVAIAKEMPGTPVKLIWSREEDMMHGRYHPVTQCKLTAGVDAQGRHHRTAHAHLGPVDTGRRRAAERQGRQGPGGVPGPQSAGAGSVDRLHVPGAADRPRDAQPDGPARILARREPEPEHDLPRVLHRRSRARDRPGSAGAAAQADGPTIRSTSRCSTPRPSAPAGASRRPGACTADSRRRWASAATSPPAPRCRFPTRAS